MLFCPPVPLATARVYQKFDELLTESPPAVTIKGCQLGLYEPETAGAVIFNMLAPAACGVLPQLAAWREALLAAGAVNIQLCGSGSAWVCLFNSLAKARELVRRLQPQLQAWAQVVHGGHC